MLFPPFSDTKTFTAPAAPTEPEVALMAVDEMKTTLLAGAVPRRTIMESVVCTNRYPE